MIKTKIKIINKSGIHARPASDFVKTCLNFNSTIEIKKADSKQWTNAKNILNVLALGLFKDDEIEILIEGEDELKAMETLKELINEGFNEK